jgi:hypothetical protein
MNINTAFDINIIERTGTILEIKFREYNVNKQITFRNSLSIIPSPLRDFAKMFKLDVSKDICPYRLYTEENIAKKWISLDICAEEIMAEAMAIDKDKDAAMAKATQFEQNCITIGCLHDGRTGQVVNIMDYSEYYCVKDCVVLSQGMRAFDKDLSTIFNGSSKEWLGLQSYLSVSAIGYHFAVKYGCLEDCYELAGKPQHFISKCISGGRTMTCDNHKIIVEVPIQDFDAVSLYPSAMSIMPGIPRGLPKVITSWEAIKDTASDYFIEINITKVGKSYHFPLIFKTIDGSKVFLNLPENNFHVDKRGLMDLIEFCEIEYDFIRGYYFDEGHNTLINEFIVKLFNLRKEYKKVGNPLENTIKLLLNSIYGKSILKPTETKTQVIKKEKFDDWIIQHYNFIKEINESADCKHIFAKMIKPINKHFNVPHFGVSVLSYSKHIMNEVMCLAESMKIPVYYQDTDSMHIQAQDVSELSQVFKLKYGRELIGSNMGQFHCDFSPIKDGKPCWSKKLIALGKKCYLDILEDEEGNTGYHCRMKGVPQAVLNNYCHERGITLEDMYMKLYNEEEITYNLLDGSLGFRKNKFYEQYTPECFTRKISFH